MYKRFSYLELRVCVTTSPSLDKKCLIVHTNSSVHARILREIPRRSGFRLRVTKSSITLARSIIPVICSHQSPMVYYIPGQSNTFQTILSKLGQGLETRAPTVTTTSKTAKATTTATTTNDKRPEKQQQQQQQQQQQHNQHQHQQKQTPTNSNTNTTNTDNDSDTNKHHHHHHHHQHKTTPPGKTTNIVNSAVTNNANNNANATTNTNTTTTTTTNTNTYTTTTTTTTNKNDDDPPVARPPILRRP